MRTSAILDELIVLARERGLRVRREAMSRGVSTGGLCVVKGVPTLFVDDRASTDAQIEVLANVLRRYEWGAREMAPPVRALLVVAGADSSSA